MKRALLLLTMVLLVTLTGCGEEFITGSDTLPQENRSAVRTDSTQSDRDTLIDARERIIARNGTVWTRTKGERVFGERDKLREFALRDEADDFEVEVKPFRDATFKLRTGDNYLNRTIVDGKVLFDGANRAVEVIPRRDGGVKLYTILKSNPAIPVVQYPIESENLEFHYQAPLWQEAGLERPNATCNATHCGDSIRPIDVVGSYAVYHRTGINNEYGTGKAFHIYRPYAVDANGDRTWAVLRVNETEGWIRIFVPRRWLDNAAYPVRVDPTFGNELEAGTNAVVTTDCSFSSCNSNRVGGVFQPIVPGTLDNITIMLRGGSTWTQTVDFSLNELDSEGANSHGQIATGTTEASIVPGNTYVTIDMNDEAITNTDYIINVAGDAEDTPMFSNLIVRYDTVSNNPSYVETTTTSGTATISDPWNLAETHSNRRYTMYASYTTGADWCYQEQANESTACGGLDTGTYDGFGSGSAGGNGCSDPDVCWADGDYVSYSGSTFGFAYVNYTKPSGATNESIWAVADPDGLVGLNLPASCWSQSPLQFRVRAQDGGGGTGVTWYCWDGSAWDQLHGENDGGDFSTNVYEEAMYWNIPAAGAPNGTLSVSLVDPSADGNVTINETFTFQVNVTCSGGPCGNVSAYLDPASDYNSSYSFYGADYRLPLSGNENSVIGTWNSDGGNDPVWVTNQIPESPYSQGGDYDGSSDATNMPNQADVNDGTQNGPQQLSIWFNASTIGTGGNGRIIWEQGGGTNWWNLYVHNEGGADRLYFTVGEGGGGGTVDFVFCSINASELYHAVAIGDWANQNMYLYLNGVLCDSKTGGLNIGNQLSSHTSNPSIGGDDGSPRGWDQNSVSGHFDGFIADFAYWGSGSTLLTADNISDIYNLGIGSSDPVKEDLVSTTPGDTPFWTPTANPFTGSCLNNMENNSCLVNWTVNTTGTINTTHEFFAYVNGTINSTVVESSRINLTIVASSAADPCDCPSSPANKEWDLSLNCELQTTCDMTGFNATFTGTGTFTVNATWTVCNVENDANLGGIIGSAASVQFGVCA